MNPHEDNEWVDKFSEKDITIAHYYMVVVAIKATFYLVSEIYLSHHRFPVHFHHKLFDAFHVRLIRKIGIHGSILEVLLPFAYQIEEFRFESVVAVLEFAITDIHQQVMFHVPVRMHLSGLQQFRPGAEQTDQMHRMLVQMFIVFLPVPVVQLLILPNDRDHLRKHSMSLPQRITGQFHIRN